MDTGRNKPCPCGSGKKYKHCCLDKNLGNSVQYKLMLVLGGVILIVCAVLIISSLRNMEGGSSQTRVWSEEHQHWH